VRDITGRRPGAVELSVDVDGEAPATAIAYPGLVGDLEPGSRVLLDTTAVALDLGTGGWHFVVAVLDGPPTDAGGTGHVMKLRYTPQQVRTLTVEEAESPHRATMERATSLDGTPVVWAPLHSMVAPIAAGARVAGAARVAYVMTDGAALPAPFSRLLARLRETGLLDAVVTSGQAFGGDLEAVTVYSALLAARHVAGADVIVAGDGPGNTGTDLTWGSTSIGSAAVLNAAAVLGGRPVAALRMSFADPRERHRGLSHHSITSLARVVLTPVEVAVPLMPDGPRRREIWTALRARGILDRHPATEADGDPALDLLDANGVHVESMGRTIAQDPEFFLAAGAAGVVAGRLAFEDTAARD
jgi:hypothetical protein